MESSDNTPTYEELLQKVQVLEGYVLKRKNDEMSLLLDNVPIMIWYMSDEETFGSVNKPFADFFGKTVDELKGKKVSYLVDNYTTEITISTNKIVFDEKRKYNRQGWLKNADGEKRLVSIIKTPKISSDGKVEFVVCTGEDITEKIKTKEALQENIEKYKSIFENSPVGILHYDNDAYITDCNEALVNIFNSKYKDIIGLNFADISYDPMMKKEFESTLHGKYASYTGEFITPLRNNKVYIKAEFAPLFSEQGYITGGIGIIQDISQQINIEKNLLDSERKYRELIENINDLSWLIEDSHFIYVNPMFEKLLNLSASDLNNNLAYQFRSIHPDDKEILLNALRGEEFKESKSFNIKFRIITNQGEVRWLWARSFPIYNDKGEIYRIAGVATDITEDKE